MVAIVQSLSVVMNFCIWEDRRLITNHSMMGDSIVTNGFILDGASVGHFGQLHVEGKDAELDQFQPSGSSRKKAI